MTKNNEWKEKFDNEFHYLFNLPAGSETDEFDSDQLKSFIQTLLDQRTREIIDGIRGQKCRCRCSENVRLDQVINHLKDTFLINK